MKRWHLLMGVVWAGGVWSLAQENATGPAAADIGADLAALERQAEQDALVAQARLETLRARRALKAGELRRAADHAQHVLDLLAQLPPELDVSVYELQAEGVLAKAARAGVEVDRRGRADPEPPPSANHSSGDAAAAYPPPPARAQRRAEEAYRDSETRALLEAQEARRIPVGWVAFPEDWPEITARRAPYADGVIARSPSWWDEQGREWYVAIYDVEDFVTEPAYFPSPIMHPAWAAQALADREALRWQSDIFRGSASELAAGLPLLRYFGGVWDVDLRPRVSREKQERLMRMIQALTEPPTGEPHVAPAQP